MTFKNRVPNAGPRVAALLLSLVVLAGCAQEQPTVTAAEAKQRIERHIADTISQLPEDAEPIPKGGTDSVACNWSEDHEDVKKILVESWYWVENLPQKDYPRYFDTVRRYWESRGYRKVRFDKNGAMWTMVYADAEEFSLVFGTTGDGEVLVIEAQSPCIWPKGTPGAS